MYIYMQSDCCEVLATPFSCGTETCWPPIASYSLDTRVSSFIQMSGWMRFSAQFFFYFRKEDEKLSWYWLAEGISLTSAPTHMHPSQQAARQTKHKKLCRGGKKSATVIWNPILNYSAHIITVPAHIRNVVWAICTGFGLFYLFLQNYPPCFIGLQILQKH